MSVPIEQARLALEMHFGYQDFRPGQLGVVKALLSGKDALAVMPTGAGKSICYQVPRSGYKRRDACYKPACVAYG